MGGRSRGRTARSPVVPGEGVPFVASFLSWGPLRASGRRCRHFIDGLGEDTRERRLPKREGPPGPSRSDCPVVQGLRVQRARAVGL